MRRKSERLILDIVSTVLYFLLNIIFYIFVVYAIMKASKYAYDFSYQVFGGLPATSGKGASQIVIEIKQGDSTMAIADALERNGIIVNKYSFYVRSKLAKSNIKPGKYRLKSSMDYDEIFRVITNKEKEKIGVIE